MKTLLLLFVLVSTPGNKNDKKHLPDDQEVTFEKGQKIENVQRTSSGISYTVVYEKNKK